MERVSIFKIGTRNVTNFQDFGTKYKVGHTGRNVGMRCCRHFWKIGIRNGYVLIFDGITLTKFLSFAPPGSFSICNNDTNDFSGCSVGQNTDQPVPLA